MDFITEKHRIYVVEEDEEVGEVTFPERIEYACDEKVTKNIENGEKAEYCRILLENSVPRKMIAACPVAFGGICYSHTSRFDLTMK